MPRRQICVVMKCHMCVSERGSVISDCLVLNVLSFHCIHVTDGGKKLCVRFLVRNVDDFIVRLSEL